MKALEEPRTVAVELEAAVVAARVTTTAAEAEMVERGRVMLAARDAYNLARRRYTTMARDADRLERALDAAKPAPVDGAPVLSSLRVPDGTASPAAVLAAWHSTVTS